MRASVWAGIALIIVGVAVYVRGGFTKKEQVLDVGPLSVSTSEKQPVPAWVAGLAVAAGVLLVVAGSRQKA
jgi:drug/metabolite transporter (DMT)-like permease